MTKIVLNGSEHHTEAKTIAELLKALEAPELGIAVAINEHVVRRGELATHRLSEGDKIEVIRAVQGG